MNTITIPRNLVSKDDLVVIPRKEYEALLRSKLLEIKEFIPTSAQRRVLSAARKRIARGEFLTFNELKTKLGFKGRF